MGYSHLRLVRQGRRRPPRDFSRRLLFAAGIGAISLTAAFARDATEYRKLADYYVRQGLYTLASDAYRSESEVYYRKNLVQAGKVEAMKADRWETNVTLYRETAPDRAKLAANYTGAKYEPLYGCYLGAFVVGDDHLDEVTHCKSDSVSRAVALGSLVGKHLASSFDYCSYGKGFPLQWAAALLSNDISPHVALEPNDGMEVVQDNAYLEQFARDAASCKGPVFLRFASEMNGDWTVYHRDPALYRQKFRLVHDVMARLAPNVIMVWCPYQIPEYNMNDFYPGDDAVDWVGINLYNVIHHNNKSEDQAWYENPTTLLNYVYQNYSARKPIAICEYGSSHREKLSRGLNYSYLAAAKIWELFAALPRQYPRVKYLAVYDCDNMSSGTILPGRQINDYSVTDSPQVLDSFRRAIASAYFLPQFTTLQQGPLPTYYAPITAGDSLSGTVRLSSVVKTYEDRPTVTYTLDGKKLARLTEPGPYGLDLNTADYSPGDHLLEVSIEDSRSQRAGVLRLPLNFVRS